MPPVAPFARGRKMLGGVWALVRGDARGLDAFEASPEAVIRSLTPWLALAATGAVLSVAGGGGLAPALTDFCVTVDVVLLPLLLVHALVARSGRDGLWRRYAAALNWCNWALPAALLLALIAADVAGGAGVPMAGAVTLALGAVSAFGLWLHVVLARHGLSLGLGRAVVLVIVTECATAMLILLRAYFGMAGLPPA